MIVVEELQAYLVAQGIGRMPQSAEELTEPVATPSIYLLPRQEAPAPIQKDDDEWLETVTVTLDDTNLQGPPGVETWLEDAFIAVTTRAKNAAEGKLVQRAIKNLLHPAATSRPVGRCNWTMNTLTVQFSAVWRGDQRLPLVDNGKTYDRVAYYRFRCARSDLA